VPEKGWATFVDGDGLGVGVGVEVGVADGAGVGVVLEPGVGDDPGFVLALAVAGLPAADKASMTPAADTETTASVPIWRQMRPDDRGKPPDRRPRL
jgi:hypothetical protein